MCVGAALFGSAKIGAGLSAATAFNIGLGLTVANALLVLLPHVHKQNKHINLHY